MILAGDIGATSARLACFERSDGRLRRTVEQVYSSQTFPGLAEIVAQFVTEHRVKIRCACVGIAGTLQGDYVQTPNLPWAVHASDLTRTLDLDQAWLINDLEANAYGIDVLEPQDLALIHPGASNASGHAVVISAGTGVNAALRFWDGVRHRPSAGECGHIDFAPGDELQIDLMRYLRLRHGHVSWERIVSGPGLVSCYHFLCERGRGQESPAIVEAIARGEGAAAISRAALEGHCALCSEALDLVVSAYGAFAGNLALTFLARGGVYLGGGITPKILARLREPGFIRSFLSKGRMSPILDAIPVWAILNTDTGLLGAARCATLRAGL